MRQILMIAGLAIAAGLSAPPSADARDACQQRNHDRKVTGTVVGAVGGALVGNAVSRDSGGTIIGGLAGAAIGNNVARIRCNDGARYAPRHHRVSRNRTSYRPAQYAATPVCRYEDQAFYDENARLVRHSVRVCR
jgi:uncharacterized protein YcfJ